MNQDLLSAGDASAAARSWLEAAKKKRPAIAGGTAPPAQPFLVAWLAARLKRPVCVVCPDVKRQEEFHHDLQFWEPRALLLPDLELAAAGVGTPDPELAAARLAALREIDTNQPPLVVVTADGLGHPAPSPRKLARGIITLRQGEMLALDDVASRLGKAGFERVSTAAQRGHYAVRGGIVDIYP